MPRNSYIVEKLTSPVDIDALLVVREFIKDSISNSLEDKFYEKYKSLNSSAKYDLSTQEIGRRKLLAVCLSYLVNTEKDEYLEVAANHYKNANNMTDIMSALSTVNNFDNSTRDELLSDFLQRYIDEELVVNKWFALQAHAGIPNVLEKVQKLTEHEAFDYGNPNKIYALIRGFTGNYYGFHRADGAGYKFIADNVIKIDGFNSQVASRVAKALAKWQHLDQNRQALVKEQLERIKAIPELSDDVFEVVDKALQ